MNFSYYQTILSLLIFSPLLAATVACFIRSEVWLRWFTFGFTSSVALLSLPLYFRFDPTIAGFQFEDEPGVDPNVQDPIRRGIDGIQPLTGPVDHTQ
jgi:NADH-quinone oxidoreductase subunit M